MKTNRKLLTGLILAAGITGIAIAQPGMGIGGGGCDGSGPAGFMGRHAAMRFDPAERAEHRLDYMKYQLKITAEQESLWNAYAEKAKAEAGKGFQAMRTQAVDGKLSAPERMAKMDELMQERLIAMKGVHESFTHLYDALTPEQKAIADKQAGRMGRGGWSVRGRGMLPSQG